MKGYNLQKLIKIKKSDFYQVKLTEKFGKPKELWKTLKSLSLPSKKSYESKTCLKKNDLIKFEDAENASIFKDFFSKLADDRNTKLPSPSGRFGISSVKSYYKEILGSPPLNFELAPTTEANILMILQSLQTDKAAGIDNISSRFLKDGAKI